MIEITIPFKTPSVNHLYFNWQNRRILTKEARELKKRIQEIVIPHRPELDFKTSFFNDSPIKITTEIHEDWYTKKGDIKRVDIANREKFLIDSVFDALNADDKFIFEHTMKKVQSTEEFARIRIEVLNANN